MSSLFCSSNGFGYVYVHPSTKESLKKLQSFGNRVIPATSGELASGLIGEGRMAEPEDIVSFYRK